MTNHEKFLDAMNGVSEKFLSVHIRKKCPTAGDKAKRYALAVAAYAAAIIAVAVILPFIIGKGEDPTPQPGDDPVVTETNAPSPDDPETLPKAVTEFEGCEFSITLDRAHYDLDDTITATVVLENKGNDTIILHQGFLGNYLDYIIFLENREMRESYSSDSDKGYPEAIQQQEFKHGDSITHTVQFTPGKPLSGDDPVAKIESLWEITAYVYYYTDTGDPKFKKLENTSVTIEVPHGDGEYVTVDVTTAPPETTPDVTTAPPTDTTTTTAPPPPPETTTTTPPPETTTTPPPPETEAPVPETTTTAPPVTPPPETIPAVTVTPPDIDDPFVHVDPRPLITSDTDPVDTSTTTDWYFVLDLYRKQFNNCKTNTNNRCAYLIGWDKDDHLGYAGETVDDESMYYTEDDVIEFTVLFINMTGEVVTFRDDEYSRDPLSNVVFDFIYESYSNTDKTPGKTEVYLEPGEMWVYTASIDLAKIEDRIIQWNQAWEVTSYIEYYIGDVKYTDSLTAYIGPNYRK